MENKNTKIVYEVTAPEFEELIKKAVRKGIEEANKKNDPFAQYPELMNKQQAAEMMGVSKSTIYKWQKAGAISKKNFPGTKRVVYSKTELLKFMKESQF
jgi:excisionase family DNA binding protein